MPEAKPHAWSFYVLGQAIRHWPAKAFLLPTTVAEGLGITTEQLGSAEVRIFGTNFRVIGLVSEDQMRKARDLDGEPMMPVNYALLRPEVLKELQRQAEQRSPVTARLQRPRSIWPAHAWVLPRRPKPRP